jgi:hypothetical protein
MFRNLCMLVCLWALGIGAASAQARLVFDGCVDARGNAVRSLADPSLQKAFETRVENGATVIRYNPAVPAALPDHVRLFFYAHECARLELGQEADAPRNVGDAWRADCRALDTILGSGLMSPQYVARLQDDLMLTEAEWDAMPGPQREIDLPSCVRGQQSWQRIHIPPQPSAAREGWNTCVRKCGDTLLQCERRTCNSLDCPACMPAHEACVAACGAPVR